MGQAFAKPVACSRKCDDKIRKSVHVQRHILLETCTPLHHSHIVASAEIGLLDLAKAHTLLSPETNSDT